jgi:hypothetical protein
LKLSGLAGAEPSPRGGFGSNEIRIERGWDADLLGQRKRDLVCGEYPFFDQVAADPFAVGLSSSQGRVELRFGNQTMLD